MPLQSAMVGVPVTGDRWRVSKSDSRRVSRGGGSEELGVLQPQRVTGDGTVENEGRWAMVNGEVVVWWCDPGSGCQQTVWDGWNGGDG